MPAYPLPLPRPARAPLAAAVLIAGGLTIAWSFGWFTLGALGFFASDGCTATPPSCEQTVDHATLTAIGLFALTILIQGMVTIGAARTRRSIITVGRPGDAVSRTGAGARQ